MRRTTRRRSGSGGYASGTSRHARRRQGIESRCPPGLRMTRAPVWFRPAVFILAPVSASFLAWSALVAGQQFGQGQAIVRGVDRVLRTRPGQRSRRRAASALVLRDRDGVDGRLLAGNAAVEACDRPPTARTPPGSNAATSSSCWPPAPSGSATHSSRWVAVGAIVDSLSAQTANDFSNALSGFAGPQTLRYATILAAPLGVYLWRKKVIGWPYMVVAVLLLVAPTP